MENDYDKVFVCETFFKLCFSIKTPERFINFKFSQITKVITVQFRIHYCQTKRNNSHIMFKKWNRILKLYFFFKDKKYAASNYFKNLKKIRLSKVQL